MKTQIGIIDDHNLFRSGIKDIIEDSGKFDVIISVSTSKALYAALKEVDIEILLLDINLKGENGMDILTQLQEDRPELKIIMLTMYKEASYINTMVQKGAHGYLMKDTTPQELIEALQKVLLHGRYYDSHTTNILIENIQAKEKIALQGIRLSQLEVDILIFISKGKTAEEISTLVFRSPRTVEGYRQKLLVKTHCKNIAELVSWGYTNKVL